MRVRMVKHRQTVLMSETDGAKRVDQIRQVPWAEHRLRAGVQCPQVHHRLVNAPFPARDGHFRERCFAGGQVEMTVRAIADELAGPNDLKVLWHNTQAMMPNRIARLNP
jgi:hypothetical protein